MELSIWNTTLFGFDPKILQFLRKEGYTASTKVITVLSDKYFQVIFELVISKYQFLITEDGHIIILCDNSLRYVNCFKINNFGNFMQAYEHLTNYIETGEN